MKLKCIRCLGISSNEMWDHFTKITFGNEIELSEDGAENSGFFYICPKCGDEVSSEEIEKILE